MTPVDDLAAWLTQIWDARQRLYEHAPEFIDEGGARGPGWGNLGGECGVCGAYQFSGMETVVEDAWYEHMEKVHQRREVLARIAADRQILALHSGIHECPYWDGNGEFWEDLYCPTALLLARAHADRPGFQNEWRVTS